AEDEALFAVDLDLRTRGLAEEDSVADLHVELPDLAVVGDLSVADRENLALDGLLFGGVGDDDPALGLLFFFDAFHDHAIVEGTNVRHDFTYLDGWHSPGASAN